MKSEDGSAIALGSFLLLAFLILAGLAIDGSRAFVGRIQMQTAADAGALAGTHMRTFEFSEIEIELEIRRIAGLNKADSIAWSYTPNGRGVSVTAAMTMETYFAPIFGHDSMTVSASGAANALAIASATDLLPFTLPCNDVAAMHTGTVYRFWTDDKVASGNTGWLDWNGGSSSSLELANNLLAPNGSGELHIGDWIDGTPGVKSSSMVRSALNSLIGKSATIPIYDSVQGTGNNTKYRLCGFARFIMTNYNFKGKDKYIEGRLVSHISRGIPTTDSDLDFGLRTIVLTE